MAPVMPCQKRWPCIDLERWCRVCACACSAQIRAAARTQEGVWEYLGSGTPLDRNFSSSFIVAEGLRCAGQGSVDRSYLKIEDEGNPVVSELSPSVWGITYRNTNELEY